ncbi:hypothetical protein HB779_22895 (plasmid) [Phyllobacterium sp. 628]|uniref:hypothetical protein n=1 Tax=Phyllobacterium sp. 628 TaxID=2718938 RepID=UPI001662756F|nr:hypothetical protein [Phyllobacterium sp. 628]QND54759.1 hypothetical protein HB779_22895 [Phyllobacterium sp. 628]
MLDDINDVIAFNGYVRQSKAAALYAPKSLNFKHLGCVAKIVNFPQRALPSKAKTTHERLNSAADGDMEIIVMFPYDIDRKLKWVCVSNG